MKEFLLSADRFFSPHGAAYEARRRDQELCKDTMPALVERFELAGRSTLSLGPGLAYEEYWLHAAGCELMLVDLDEHGTLEPLLRTMEESSPDKPLRYALGNAGEWLSVHREPDFGLLYVSSFTPDEVRRGHLRDAAVAGAGLRAAGNAITARLFGRRPFRLSGRWPAGADPFGPMVTAALALLEPGGVFISQSYAFSVDPVENPHFVTCAQAQLRRHGLELVEFLHYDPEWTDVSLAVAVKADPGEARAYAARVAARKDLMRFHGRSTIRTGIRRVPITLP